MSTIESNQHTSDDAQRVSAYRSKAKEQAENEVLEYIKYIQEARMLNSNLQGYVVVADASGNYTGVSGWSGGSEQSWSVKIEKSWKCNIKLLYKLFLQQVRIHAWGASTITARKITFKRKDDRDKWCITSVAENNTISAKASGYGGRYRSIFTISQTDLASPTKDFMGSKEWQIDFDEYKANGSCAKMDFCVQYAKQ